MQFLNFAQGVGIGLEIDKETFGPITFADGFTVDFDLFRKRFVTFEMVSRRSPLITETADFAPVQTLPVRASLGDRNADFENLGPETFTIMPTDGMIGFPLPIMLLVFGKSSRG